MEEEEERCLWNDVVVAGVVEKEGGAGTLNREICEGRGP